MSNNYGKQINVNNPLYQQFCEKTTRISEKVFFD